MPAPGWGAEFGQNFGAGGVVYLTNLAPEPGGLVPSDNSIRFTIGVQGGLIDLSSVQITISSQLAFSGFTAITQISSVTNNGGLFEIQTLANHGLSTGQEITISGAVGAPVNGVWFVTVIDSTHFALNGSIYSAGYTSGGEISLPPSFSSDFSASSYEHSVPDNGYSFVLISSVQYPQVISVVVTANTLDGGSSTQSYQVASTVQVIYPPMTYGIPLDNIPLDSFSGEVQTGILAGNMGQIFFSPALPVANTGSQLDVDSVETVVRAADSYDADPTNSNNLRPFLWGPPPPPAIVPTREYPPDMSVSNYLPVWNSWNAGPGKSVYGTLKTSQATATGILTDVPTGKQTVILY
jgi:hypothetical protein